jgi:plastocyanin
MLKRLSPGRRAVARGGLVALLVLPVLAPAPRSAAPRVHVVRLLNNRFDPAEVRVAVGDTIRFVNGPGGPHNVQFMPESTAVAAHEMLNVAMKDRIGPLASPLFIIEGDTYQLVVPQLPAGRYPFLCNPHWANMRGAMIVTGP